MTVRMKRAISPPAASIGQRLKLEMKRRSISSAELAKRADVKTSFLYDVISGKSTNPSTVKLARVAECLNISLGYLVGSSDNPQSETAREKSAGAAYVSIPRITVEVSAGSGRFTSVEHEEESYHFRKAWITDRLKVSPEDLRLLYIRGDSMEPTLYHNDIVLVDITKKTPSPPGIFVLFDGFGLASKRLEFTADHKRVRIMSDNPQYSTYERSAAETFIIGRAVWFAREI